jgi:hypothetical protein
LAHNLRERFLLGGEPVGEARQRLVVFNDVIVQLADTNINGFYLELGLLYLCIKSVYLGLERLVGLAYLPKGNLTKTVLLSICRGFGVLGFWGFGVLGGSYNF